MSVSMNFTLDVNGTVADCYGVARMWEAELHAQDPRLKTTDAELVHWNDKNGKRRLDSLADDDYDECVKDWPMSLAMSVHDRQAYGVNTEVVVTKIAERFPNTILKYCEYYPQENETVRVYFGGKEVAHLYI
jgi:hypothetical protein